MVAFPDAIKSCPRGKACGPDGLGNDWYRDQVADIAPVLVPLYHAGVLPYSFSAASVFCVAKKSAPTTGLDYRPIALLNTDYKIYARVLLTRVRSQVERLVTSTQYGFVPGRQVHNAIGLWTALHRQAPAGLLPPTALAVFLDFSKADDPLDRRFLTLALRRHGFSDTLVLAVETMHLGTTAAYIVDGQTSATEAVETGIRQGCPFAPTLFILAVDVLYVMVHSDPRLPGLRLDDATSVSIVGFADDTTAYLRSPAQSHVLGEFLNTFADASGLTVNATKSMVVMLTVDGYVQAPTDIPFPLALPSQLVRYLASQVATDLVAGAVWDVTVQQLRARLLLAAVKTTDLLQRIQVCQAVILPQLLFVARHVWPSSLIVQRNQRFLHNYAWHGVLQDAGLQRRAWMYGEGGAGGWRSRHPQLPRRAPSTEREVCPPLALGNGHCGRSLRPHSCWGSPPTCWRKRLSAARSREHHPPVSNQATCGPVLLQAASTIPRDEDESASIITLLAHAGRASLSSGSWVDGWYHRSYACHQEELRTIGHRHSAQHWRLDASSLLAAPVVSNDLLLHASGRPLRASDLPGLRCTSVTIGEHVELAWVSPFKLRFRLRSVAYPYPAVSSFRLLVDTLVMCYPRLLHPQDPPEYLQERVPRTDVWLLRPENDRLHLYRELSPHHRQDLGEIASHRHAIRLARAASHCQSLYFAPHPWLSVAISLWGSTDVFAKSNLRRLAAGSSGRHAEVEIEARTEAATAQSAAFGDALSCVDWAAVHTLSHSSSRQRILFHRVKGLRLSEWDQLHERRGCPHCPS